MSVDYDRVLTDVEENIEARDAVVTAAIDAQTRPHGKVRRIVTLVALVGVVIGLVIVWLPLVKGAVTGEPVYAIGPTGDDPKLAQCLRTLWQVRAALDHYRYAHDGQLPERLDQLEGDGIQVCPVTGKPWRYVKREDGAYIIACPDPGAVGRSAVFLDQRFGPPQVRLQGAREEL